MGIYLEDNRPGDQLPDSPSIDLVSSYCEDTACFACQRVVDSGGGLRTYFNDGTNHTLFICRDCWNKGPAFLAARLQKLAESVKAMTPAVWGTPQELRRAELMWKLARVFRSEALEALDLAELEKLAGMLAEPDTSDIPF